MKQKPYRRFPGTDAINISPVALVTRNPSKVKIRSDQLTYRILLGLLDGKHYTYYPTRRLAEYIRQLPTRLFLSETQGEVFEEREIRPTFTDPYTIELQIFYDVVTQNVQPKTSAEDFLHDLDLFEMIINALRT